MSNLPGSDLARSHVPRLGFELPALKNIREFGFQRWLESFFVGHHRLIRGVRSAVLLAAQEEWPVLLTGETGTGKDMIAQAIHAGSPRHGSAPHVVAVSGLGDTAWSVLFGHRKGAFTGAEQDHDGIFKQAQGSTIILEDISDLPTKIQPMLLRAVEHGIFRPLGASHEVHVDVRIISTTNVALADEVAAKRFRSDLYQRISPLRILLPPLRDHLDDLDELVPHFLGRAASNKRPPKRISGEAMMVLRSHTWPRNVRELEHLLIRATIEVEDAVIQACDVERMLEDEGGGRYLRQKPGRPAIMIGRDRLREVLAQAMGNKREAARRLDVSPSTLYSLLRRHGIESGSQPTEFERV